MRERLPADADPAEIEEAVLFVHGATFGGDTFDLELEGYDWMTHLASRPCGVLRRPARADHPAGGDVRSAEKNEPFARAAEVVGDIGDAVDFILEQTARTSSAWSAGRGAR